MTVPVNVRVSDRGDLKAPTQNDFVVRDRNPTLPQVYLLCFLPVAVVIATSIIIYKQMLYGGLLAVMLGVTLMFFALETRKHQGIINTSEFLSALLASALTYEHKFCAILKEDGTIVYLDRGFQRVFPAFIEQPERTLGVLFNLYKTSPENHEKFMDILKKNIHASVTVPMENGEAKQASDLTFSIDPINRPGGFILLRGK